MKSMHRVTWPLPVLQRVAFFCDCFPQARIAQRPRLFISWPLHKFFIFVASVRELFVRQLYRAERFFPAIENCGGVCEEEASKEDRHKKR
jgi:hypothetical protein